MGRDDQSQHSSTDVRQLWEDLSPETKRLVGKVIEIEKSKLHMSLPRNVNEELVQAIKEIVR